MHMKGEQNRNPLHHRREDRTNSGRSLRPNDHSDKSHRHYDLPFHVFACENRHRRPGRAIVDIHPVYAKTVLSAIDKRLLGPIGPQKETVSRSGVGAAENWTVIWFGLEYA